LLFGAPNTLKGAWDSTVKREKMKDVEQKRHY